MSEKEKEGLAFGKCAPSADGLAARDDTREQEERKEKEGEWVAQVLRLTRIVVVRSLTGSRRAAPLASVIVAVFEFCMLTMRTEGGVRSREPAISAVRNLDLDKVGTANSLTGCHGHGDHHHRKNQTFKTRGSRWRSDQMGC